MKNFALLLATCLLVIGCDKNQQPVDNTLTISVLTQDAVGCKYTITYDNILYVEENVVHIRQAVIEAAASYPATQTLDAVYDLKNKIRGIYNVKVEGNCVGGI